MIFPLSTFKNETTLIVGILLLFLFALRTCKFGFDSSVTFLFNVFGQSALVDELIGLLEGSGLPFLSLMVLRRLISWLEFSLIAVGIFEYFAPVFKLAKLHDLAQNG
jgi:hypothetical protein